MVDVSCCARVMREEKQIGIDDVVNRRIDGW